MQINIEFKVNSFVESHKSCVKKSLTVTLIVLRIQTMLLLVIVRQEIFI
jgi:hypothetical protein